MLEMTIIYIASHRPKNVPNFCLSYRSMIALSIRVQVDAAE
jgi:hypothetical protein